MSSKRIFAIEYMRGISMLGVIGIHVGSQYLMNPSANIHLVALFEIVTRFCVPIFFFISAFGLFYGIDIYSDFSYKKFLKRRAKSVLIPYIFWSFFYIAHYAWLYNDHSLLNFKTIIKYLTFGFSSYHLYFMVILIWFYLLMPLWIWLMRKMNMKYFILLFIFQVFFNYYSSYMMMPCAIENPYIRALLANRLNYWVIHYVFIFMAGGYAAVHFKNFRMFCHEHFKNLAVFFIVSLAALLCLYYYVINSWGYTPVEAVNTAHQLSPPGVFYTLAASIFLFAFFDDVPKKLSGILGFLGRNSYFAYLAHPLAITYVSLAVAKMGRVITAPIAILFYMLTVCLTLGAAYVIRSAGEKIPVINTLTIGK